MKRILSVVCLLCLSATTLFAKPDPKNAEAYNAVVQDYINCHMNSDSKKLSRILHDDASFKIPRGENLVKQDKQSLVDLMKKQTGTKLRSHLCTACRK